jgi:hypothetical protein
MTDLIDPVNHFLSHVISVEQYETAFRRTAEKIGAESPTLRREGRREWMAFMRVNITDYISRCPYALNDLAEFLQDTINHGRGGRAYLADARAVLAAVTASFHEGDTNE